MLVPSTALVLPIFLELSAAKLIGNPLAAILPFSFFPFGVYLTYIYFSTAISRDLLDAARIDGAGEVQVFARIAMPLAAPVVALVAFFNFTSSWNNYFLPYVTLPGPQGARCRSASPSCCPTCRHSIRPTPASTTSVAVGAGSGDADRRSRRCSSCSCSRSGSSSAA